MLERALVSAASTFIFLQDVFKDEPRELGRGLLGPARLASNEEVAIHYGADGSWGSAPRESDGLWITTKRAVVGIRAEGIGRLSDHHASPGWRRGLGLHCLK
jgi:hypothetical protein